jgi:PAS domain S-box-containing protein
METGLTKTAAVVDDNAVQRKVLTHLLEKMGIDATSFESADAALAAMDPLRPPDVIVTDLNMPGIDGWRFCRLLRSAEYAPFNHIPILAVSAAFTGEEAARISAEVGADAFLRWPLDGKRFIARVRSLVEGEAPAAHFRVLIVDASGFLADHLAAAFEAAGYRTDRASTVRRATAAAAQVHYDAAIIDDSLPDENGELLLERLTADHPDCVSIMITDDPAPELACRLMEKGAAAYVRKPFDPNYLMTLLARARREKAWLRSERLLEERTRRLRENESMLAEAEAIAGVGSFVHDIRNDSLRWSPNMYAIAGLEKDSAPVDLSAVIHRCVHPDDREQVRREVFDMVAKRAPRPIEFRIVRPDGGVRLLRSRSKILCDDEGTPTVAIGVHYDITEQRRAETALRESDNRLRAVIQNMPVMLDAFDENLKIVAWNRECERVTGYGEAEIKAHPEPMKLLYPDDARRNRIMADFTRHGPDFRNREWEATCRDGSVRTISWSNISERCPIPGWRTWAVGVDVTDRKRAEAAYRESERIKSLVLDATSELIGYYDTDLWVLWTNRAAAEFAGKSPEELVNFRCFELWHGAPQPCARCPVVKARDTGLPQTGEVRTPDGGCFWVHAHPVFDEQGRLVALIEFGHNITDRKRAEEERRRLEAHIASLEKAESLARMAGAIAHNFNNQLSVVMGNLEMALEDLPRDAEVRRDLMEAMQAARRSAEISGLMLTYLGQGLGRRAPLDLSRVCRLVLPSPRSLLPDGVRLMADLPDPGPVVDGAADGIKQCITHLTTNAGESLAGRPGTIRLTVGTIPASEIPADHRHPLDWAPKGDAYACIAVSDTGPGIETADLDRIFDPFFTRKATGRGLGLAVVLGIVRRHEGAVAVESAPGVGSVFQLFFPLSADAGSAASETVGKRGEAGAGGVVLLVDDEAPVRQMAKAMLENLGYTVMAVEDGTEALARFSEQRRAIRCVICDLTMPGMDGWETLAALRKQDPDIPVILASGYDQAFALGNASGEKPQAFLQKPYLRRDLEAALATALDSGRAT